MTAHKNPFESCDCEVIFSMILISLFCDVGMGIGLGSPLSVQGCTWRVLLLKAKQKTLYRLILRMFHDVSCVGIFGFKFDSMS